MNGFVRLILPRKSTLAQRFIPFSRTARRIAAVLAPAPHQAHSPSLSITRRFPMTLLAVPFGLEAAGGWSNAVRRGRFLDRYNDPAYRGPTIVAEGDSWFCYPIEFPFTPAGSPKDMILWLLETYAVLNAAIPGATTRHYREQFRGEDGNGGLASELRTFQPHILLLSGGGNDLLGDLGAWLPDKNRPLDDYLSGAFRTRLASVVDNLEWVARRSIPLVTKNDLAIIFNGYDEAVPGVLVDDWLLGPMTALGIPASKHQLIVNKMILRFNEALGSLVRRLERDFGGAPSRFQLAETWGSVGRRRWYNEIHPDTDGFKAIADKFSIAIEKAHPRVA
jgi:hypothetical protein